VNNRISTFLEDQPETQNDRKEEPQPIGEILEELLAQYQRRFPDLGIAVMETPVSAL
jgi:hypothetical protein